MISLQPGADTQGRWLDAQTIYERLGGATSGATSFRNAARKTRRLLAVLLKRRYAQLATNNPALRGRLRHFVDVLIPDGCAFKIAAALAHQYPGTGCAAEFKLHAVHSLRAQGMIDLSVSPGSMHDNDGFWPKWVKNAPFVVKPFGPQRTLFGVTLQRVWLFLIPCRRRRRYGRTRTLGSVSAERFR